MPRKTPTDDKAPGNPRVRLEPDIIEILQAIAERKTSTRKKDVNDGARFLLQDRPESYEHELKDLTVRALGSCIRVGHKLEVDAIVDLELAMDRLLSMILVDRIRITDVARAIDEIAVRGRNFMVVSRDEFADRARLEGAGPE